MWDQHTTNHFAVLLNITAIYALEHSKLIFDVKKTGIISWQFPVEFQIKYE